MQHMFREANKYVDGLAVLGITLNDNFCLYWICPTSLYFVYLWKVPTNIYSSSVICLFWVVNNFIYIYIYHFLSHKQNLM